MRLRLAVLGAVLLLACEPTDEAGMTASGGCDTKSAWPVWFDALPNRAH
jgi:hypothetical protein